MFWRTATQGPLFLPQRHRDTEVQEVSSFGSESHLRFQDRRSRHRRTRHVVAASYVGHREKPELKRRPRCTVASSVSVHSKPSVSDGDSGTITRPQNVTVLPNSVPLYDSCKSFYFLQEIGRRSSDPPDRTWVTGGDGDADFGRSVLRIEPRREAPSSTS